MPPNIPELRVIKSATTLPYLLSIPLGNNKPIIGFPILCFLHGYDESEPHPIKDTLTKHGPLYSNNPARVKEEFIIIAPQMPKAGDLWHKYSEDVKNIVSKIQNEEKGDKNRTYLTGFSFGGNGVFDIAEKQPNFWAALWPVDLTRVPQIDPQRPIWISIGSAARRSTNGFISKLNLNPAAEENIFADRIYLDQNQDHVGCARMAYKDERIYDWLLSKSLK